jgi:hypothetical protein
VWPAAQHKAPEKRPARPGLKQTTLLNGSKHPMNTTASPAVPDPLCGRRTAVPQREASSRSVCLEISGWPTRSARRTTPGFDGSGLWSTSGLRRFACCSLNVRLGSARTARRSYLSTRPQSCQRVRPVWVRLVTDTSHHLIRAGKWNLRCDARELRFNSGTRAAAHEVLLLILKSPSRRRT